MADTRTATHRHRTHGPVILLESTAQLGKVMAVPQGDEMWVKLVDLTEGAHLVTKKAPRKSQREGTPDFLGQQHLPHGSRRITIQRSAVFCLMAGIQLLDVTRFPVFVPPEQA